MADPERLRSGVSDPISINFDRPVPVFPLPGCVLLPGAMLPLHVFEPRYRQMTCEALDSDGLIAIAHFRGPVSQQDYLHGRPPIRDHVCIGYCHQYRPLADGRYLLLLGGVCRARVLREVDHQPYRKVMLRATEEPSDGAEPTLMALRERFAAMVGDPVLSKLPQVEEIQPLLGKPVSTPALLDLAISALCDEPEDRYHMLAEADPHRRGEWLLDRLADLRAKVDPRHS